MTRTIDQKCTHVLELYSLSPGTSLQNVMQELPEGVKDIVTVRTTHLIVFRTTERGHNLAPFFGYSR
jgi:hypothetical protein